MRYRDYLIKHAANSPGGSIFQDYEDQQNKAIQDSQQYRTGLNSYGPSGKPTQAVAYAEKLLGPNPVHPAVLGPPETYFGGNTPWQLSDAYRATRYAPDYRTPEDYDAIRRHRHALELYTPKPRQVQSYEYRKVRASNGQGYTRQKFPVTRTDYEPDTSYMSLRPRNLPSYAQYVFSPAGREVVAAHNKWTPPTSFTDYGAEMDAIDELNRRRQSEYPDGQPAWWDEGRHGPWVIPYDEDAINRAVTKVGPEYVKWLDDGLNRYYMFEEWAKNDERTKFTPNPYNRLTHEKWVNAGRPPMEEFNRQLEEDNRRIKEHENALDSMDPKFNKPHKRLTLEDVLKDL